MLLNLPSQWPQADNLVDRLTVPILVHRGRHDVENGFLVDLLAFGKHRKTLAQPRVNAALLPRRKTNPYVHIETYANMTNADVSARLSRESVSGQVAVPAAVYRDGYGSLRPRSGSLRTERRDVYGRVKGF